MNKPNLSFWQIWNMCFGFLGIQFGLALQNANGSRIFQTLGAAVDEIPILFIAAPLTGLIVQPIIGYMSDKTWTRLGRRRPFFFWGAIVTSLSLIAMPHSPSLWIAAGVLWILDAGINVTMEPFRAFVGDNLNSQQRTKGYVLQSFFIGIGAVAASMMPWVLQNVFGVANIAPDGGVPDAVRYSFYFGAAVLLAAVLWTVFSSKEYSPEELAAFDSEGGESADDSVAPISNDVTKPALWIAAGAIITGIVFGLDFEPELYVLSGGLISYGILLLIAQNLQSSGKTSNGYFEVFSSLEHMPVRMKELALVQFFSWFALFAMWIYTTPAVTAYHYGTTDSSSALFNDGANWVGVLFAVYNGAAAVAAMIIPHMINRLGAKATHQINLGLGALGFLSFFVIKDPTLLMVSMVGVGFAWCSILSIPYALLADAIPQNRLGVYMGVFNFFIVIPQLLAATVLGLIVKYGFGGEPIYALLIGAVSWFIAAAVTQRVGKGEAT